MSVETDQLLETRSMAGPADWAARDDVFALLSSGQAGAAIAVMHRLASGRQHFLTAVPVEVTEFLTRVVGTAVTIRDGGRHEEAVQVLKAVLQLNPLFLQAHKELLVVLILNQNRMAEALDHIRANPQLGDQPWIMFWETECFRRLGDWPKMADSYARLMPSAIWFFPFEIIWAEISFEVARYTVGLIQNLSAGWSQGTWKTRQLAAIPNALLVGFLDPFGKSPTVFQKQLRRCLETAIPGFDLHQSTIQFVLEHLDRLDSVQQAIFFYAITSLCKDEAIRLFLADQRRLAVLAHFPGFIKSFDLFVQRTGEFALQFETCLAAFLRSKALEQFTSGDHAAFDFDESTVAVTAALEICSRYRDRLQPAKRDKLKLLSQAKRTTPEREARKHLFVGLFGQMRAPNEALPPQVQFLRKDLKSWLAEGNLVSFGVATWQETGAKIIEAGNPHFQYGARLPKELADFVTATEFKNFSDFKTRFPATGDKVMAMSRQYQEINAAYIHQAFVQAGFNTDSLFINIRSEADFMAELGMRMEAAFGDYPTVLNQGRMFHRIAAFADLSAQAGAKSGVPVSHYALIRPDVIFTSGSITDVVRRTSEPGQERTVFCDLDMAAQFMDGMGDRYFIGQARPVTRLFEATKLIAEMLQPDFWPYYKHRIIWHALPRTILYESDCLARPIQPGPGFYFHRARYGLADVAAELSQDLAGVDDERARQLRALLN
ncbi:MAG: hypothetical protein POG74_04450 [Acidocella sp.]|nr:hypothetical protein [Acidocella sp.]